MKIIVKNVNSEHLVPVKGAIRWNIFLKEAVWFNGFTPVYGEKAGVTSISNIDKMLDWSY